MIPQTELDYASRLCLGGGMKILQSFRLHPTDMGHVERLLSLAAIESGDWLDIGCGFGEFARLAQILRPRLRFTLLNYNEFQLTHAPSDMPRVRADMHNLPFASGSFDGAMFLYSLCHADGVVSALSEAARVVRPGGRLVVYDFTGDSDRVATWEALYARFYPHLVLESMGDAVGWKSHEWTYPQGVEIAFQNSHLFRNLRPTVWKAAL